MSGHIVEVIENANTPDQIRHVYVVAIDDQQAAIIDAMNDAKVGTNSPGTIIQGASDDLLKACGVAPGKLRRIILE